MNLRNIDLTEDSVFIQPSSSQVVSPLHIDYIHSFGMSLDQRFRPFRIYPWTVEEISHLDWMELDLSSADAQELMMGFRFWMDGIDVFVTGNFDQRSMRKAIIQEELLSSHICMKCGAKISNFDRGLNVDCTYLCNKCKVQEDQDRLKDFLFQKDVLPETYSTDRDWKCLREF